jgi:cytochrome P450
MTEELSLPRFAFRNCTPSIWTMLRRGVSYVASVIPETILTLPAVQLPGPGAPLIIADPALIREVLGDRDGRFERDRFTRRLFRRAWGKGLAGAEGEAWQHQRRAAAPAFRPQEVARLLTRFEAASANAARDWPVEVPMELTARTARIIAEILFSALVDGHGKVDAAAVATDMPQYIGRIARFGLRDLLPLPEAWHDRFGGVSSDPAVQRLRALAARLAAERDENRLNTDLISLLEAVGPVEDNIRGLFPAAMDTTSAGTAWALYTLALRPHWQARVAAEARGCKGPLTLEQLPVTRRVVQEVLRLYPPGPMLIRSAAADTEIGGCRVRKGQPVMPHIYAVQRHRTLWDSPDAFDPDRFLPERGHHSGWLPFGAGPRMCIAAQFALAEIAVVIARLLGELELAPTGPEPEVNLQVTTRSTTGLNVIARRRI